MYTNIFNPKTNRWVNINGKLGKKIFNNYLNLLVGGHNGPCIYDNTISGCKKGAKQTYLTTKNAN